LITVYLLFLEMDWRNSIVQAGIVVLVLAIFFALTRLKTRPGPTQGFVSKIRLLVRSPIVVVLFMVTILAVGVELGTIGILTTYLMELRQFTQFTSKIGLIVFFAGVASGRLIIGVLTREDRIARNLLALFTCATLFFLVLYFLDLDGFTYLSIFLAGITISAMLPLIITLAGLLFKDLAGTVIGVIKMAIPVGGILIPFVMSLAARYTNLQTSLLVFPLAFLLALGLFAFGLRGADTRSSPPMKEAGH